MKYLAIKNFERFQHYHDRIPPWIKLYNSLLDDYAFLQLGDAARSHLILLWLVASRHKNRIPNDPKYIASAIHARGKVDIAALVDGGFVVFTDDATPEQPASKTASPLLAPTLASCTESGDAEGEKRERERREEGEVGKSTPRRASRAIPLPPWATPLADRWISRVGDVTPVKMRRHLAAAVGVHGEAAVLRAIEAWVTARREAGKPCKLEWFADEVSVWVERTKPIVDPATGLLNERGMAAFAGGSR
jgi:hypothetical protein